MRVTAVLAAISLSLTACESAQSEAPPDPVAARTDAVVTIPPGTHQVRWLSHYFSYYDGGSLDDLPGWKTGDGPLAGLPQFSGKGPFGYGESYIVTPLRYGPDPAHKRTTTYFVGEFIAPVGSLAHVKKLELRVMYDDGFVFYVNGHEGGRASMPDGPVSYATHALDHEAGARYVSFDITSQLAHLGEGYENYNKIGFEVHQATDSSSDLVFDAELIAYLDDGPVVVTTQEGIPRGSAWHVWDAKSAPPTAWKTPTFDDSGWASGLGPFGYGEDNLATYTAPGAITTYFRKTFTVEGSRHALTAHVMYDDGFVVYLNGKELGRASMPSGTITPTTPALDHESGLRYVDFDWTWALPQLKQGLNTLTVEVHQTSTASSDLVFDLGLDVVGGWDTFATPLAPRPQHSYESEFSAWFTDATHVVGTSNNEIARSTDGGHTWTTAPTFTGPKMRVRFADAQHGVIYGTGGWETATGVHFTADGGVTWSERDTSALFVVHALDFTSATLGFAISRTATGEVRLYRTDDAGATWTAIANAPDEQLYGLHFTDAQHGWLVGKRIYRTDDGGASFTQVYAGTGQAYLKDVAIVDASTIVAVGSFTSNAFPEPEWILISRDGGVNWSSPPKSHNDQCLRFVQFVDPQHGFAGGCGGGILRTDDAGATWKVQRVARPEVGEPELTSFHMFDLANGFAADEDGHLITTHTGGL